MPKYLLQVRYTGEGLQGVMRDGGTARRAAAEEVAKQVGGSIESFLFAFGDKPCPVCVWRKEFDVNLRVFLTVLGVELR